MFALAGVLLRTRPLLGPWLGLYCLKIMFAASLLVSTLQTYISLYNVYIILHYTLPRCTRPSCCLRSGSGCCWCWWWRPSWCWRPLSGPSSSSSTSGHNLPSAISFFLIILVSYFPCLHFFCLGWRVFIRKVLRPPLRLPTPAAPGPGRGRGRSWGRGCRDRCPLVAVTTSAPARSVGVAR